eukprot:9449203-Alexandrium_andersonii.AAC.1
MPEPLHVDPRLPQHFPATPPGPLPHHRATDAPPDTPGIRRAATRPLASPRALLASRNARSPELSGSFAQ